MPSLAVIRMGMMRQPPAGDAMPTPLLVDAAAQPATWVPWPRRSLVSVLLSYVFQPGTILAERSGWLPSTPVSSIATITLLLPIVVDQAAGAAIFGRCHCEL